MIERDGHVHQTDHQLGNFNGTESQMHTNVASTIPAWLLASPIIILIILFFCNDYSHHYNFYSLGLAMPQFKSPVTPY